MSSYMDNYLDWLESTTPEERLNPKPCQCHESFAYISPTHRGHCCFVPESQTCHPAEVAEWERGRDRRRPSCRAGDETP
jgi:hypothetical protein